MDKVEIVFGTIKKVFTLNEFIFNSIQKELSALFELDMNDYDIKLKNGKNYNKSINYFELKNYNIDIIKKKILRSHSVLKKENVKQNKNPITVNKNLKQERNPDKKLNNFLKQNNDLSNNNKKNKKQNNLLNEINKNKCEEEIKKKNEEYELIEENIINLAYEKNKLDSQNGRYNLIISNNQIEILENRNINKVLTKEIQEQNQIKINLNSKIAQSKKNKLIIDDDLEKTKKEYESLKKQYDSKSKENNILTINIKEKNKQYNNLINEIESLNEKINVKKNEMKSISTEIDIQKKKNENLKEKIENELYNLKKDYSEIEVVVKNLKEKKFELENEESKINERMKKTKIKIIEYNTIMKEQEKLKEAIKNYQKDNYLYHIKSMQNNLNEKIEGLIILYFKKIKDDYLEKIKKITEEKFQLYKNELYELEKKRNDQFKEKENENNILKNDLLLISESNNIIHKDIICRKCGLNPIKGILYKCSDCEEYYLCEKCEEINYIDKLHPHYFIKIRKNIKKKIII